MNKSRVVFELPSSSTAVDVEDDDHHSSAVAQTTSDTRSGEKHSCDPSEINRKRPTATTTKSSVKFVAVEFLLDQQRFFLSPSRLQPFQVNSQNSSQTLHVGPVNPLPYKNSFRSDLLCSVCVCVCKATRDGSRSILLSRNEPTTPIALPSCCHPLFSHLNNIGDSFSLLLQRQRNTRL